MKILLLSIMTFLCILSCKKKEVIVDSNTDFIDSTSIASNVDSSEIFIPTEYSPEKLSTFLSEKKNDTLYITNFFATWCGPCMKEIPHFKQKMKEVENLPVKFTFVSLDRKKDWNTDVKKFSEKENLSKHIVLLDGNLLTPDFFKSNFKDWDGRGIPFTFMRKGNETDEYMSMMTKQQLDEMVDNFISKK